MKKFNASDLSKKPSELFKAAREDGAIIQHKDRQGNVIEEFAMIPNKLLVELIEGSLELSALVMEIGNNTNKG